MYPLLGESEEASELRAAVQDLETQIEEQKLKIQNTPNQILRVSLQFCIWAT